MREEAPLETSAIVFVNSIETIGASVAEVL